ncbi:MAG: cobalamin synthesis protein P47K, partial [Candidatus Hydrogenedentes bacterium]|nr:cobalamin synthesis protein P47K [Candidatus Hydrogenedentota bacterium]
MILAGGFLGAGKTTLLYGSAKRLARQDRRVGLITNDQAPELVDTTLLVQSGSEVREVAGSCFCCNFNGFLGAVRSLENAGVDHVIAEPVGSCTDLSATIVQPLKELFPAWRVAPLSVLVDPRRVQTVLRTKHPRLHEDAAYILKTQLQEADQIVLAKADLLAAPEREELLAYLAEEFPGARPTHLSALTGEGVDTWLESVLEDTTGGLRITAVDYERYAQG